jgi:hypothetical protein
VEVPWPWVVAPEEEATGGVPKAKGFLVTWQSHGYHRGAWAEALNWGCCIEVSYI